MREIFGGILQGEMLWWFFREVDGSVWGGETVQVGVRIPIQDYDKSVCLYVMVMIRATLVNTHTHTDRQLLTSYTIS